MCTILERHFQGIAQEPHEGTAGGERRRHVLQESRPITSRSSNSSTRNEVGPLQILDERVLGRETARRTLRESRLVTRNGY